MSDDLIGHSLTFVASLIGSGVVGGAVVNVMESRREDRKQRGVQVEEVWLLAGRCGLSAAALASLRVRRIRQGEAGVDVEAWRQHVHGQEKTLLPDMERLDVIVGVYLPELTSQLQELHQGIAAACAMANDDEAVSEPAASDLERLADRVRQAHGAVRRDAAALVRGPRARRRWWRRWVPWA